MTAAPHRDWDPDCYARNATFVGELALPVVALLAPKHGERILDLGCGDGVLSQRIEGKGATVIGIDASPAMIARASERGIEALLLDAADLATVEGFAGRFDGVFSNAALHWMKDLPTVLAGVARVLKPGGRFAGEMGGEGNVGSIQAALRWALGQRGIDFDGLSPWVFPAPEEFRRMLETAGLKVQALDRLVRPTLLPGGLREWLETLAPSVLDLVSWGEREALVDQLERTLAPRLRGEDGSWTLDYVRLRFLAIKPAAKERA